MAMATRSTLHQARRSAIEPLGQRLALQVLHHQEVDGWQESVGRLPADVVQRADVQVVERRDRLRLALEKRCRISRLSAQCGGST